MTRTRLPARRRNETIRFEHAGHTYFATLGYYEDGWLGELFLSSGKVGTALDVATRDSAIAISFALQYGCTAEMIRGAFLRDEDGTPHGALGRLFDILAERIGAPAS